MQPTLLALVRSYMAAHGLTPNALAQQAASTGKVSRTSVYDYLNGAHDLTGEKIDVLLGCLSVPLPDLAPATPVWVIEYNHAFWNRGTRTWGSFADATRFDGWDEAVEAAQEECGLPVDRHWGVVAV